MHTCDGGEVPTNAYTRLTWLEMQGLESSLGTGEAMDSHLRHRLESDDLVGRHADDDAGCTNGKRSAHR